MELEFGGLAISKLEDLKNELDFIYESDYELILLTNKTYKHREEELSFDYKYAVSAINMYSSTGDEQFINDPFCISVYLVVSPTSLDDNVINSIKGTTDGYCEYQDILQLGYGVRLLYDNDIGFPIEGIEEKMYEIANLIEPLDNLRGFFLDRSINKIGSTGWDRIWNCVSDESFIKRALERIG